MAPTPNKRKLKMRILKYLTCGLMSLALAGAFGSDAMAQEKKKKKKKKKKSEPAGETTNTSGAEGASAPATAAAGAGASSGGGYKVGYGAAGCGLGSIVLGAKPGFMQVFAATTNGTSGSQTFGITTGTSNCMDPPSGDAAAEERKVYVDMNYADLSKEAAQGEGEHLEAFADILGCAESDEDLAAFQMLSQEKYASLYGNQAADAVVDGYVNEIKSDETLSKNCVRIY